ncbi:MAG: hypothetical protein RJA36_1185 [Pseudomonadota bacterium]|jgi:hypothetical protein
MKLAQYALRAILLLLAVAVPVLILLQAPIEPMPPTFDGRRFAAWLCCLAGLIGLFVATGITIRGRALGVLVDERNRYSLSRLQMSLWTVLVLATLYTTLMANVVRGGADQALVLDLDYNLVVLMGFSIASLVAAPMALSRRADQTADTQDITKSSTELQAKQGLKSPPVSAGRVMVKAHPQDARLADLIRGEDVANATVVDLPRLQMLLITAVVIVAYGAAVGHQLATDDWVMHALVELKPTLTLLVLVSHVGYITGKLIPSSGSAASAQATPDAGRALRASQRAASLAAELQSRLQATAPGDPRSEWLRNGLALARGLAAEAAVLPAGTVASPDGVARIEGRMDALESTLSREPTSPAVRQMLDGPAPAVVSQVQRLLYQRGYGGVQVTGIPDVPTEQAIGSELAKLGIDRQALHPRTYRFFEEVAQLL